MSAVDLQRSLALAQDQARQAFGDALISLILFGSAVGGDFLPGTSDINLLAVVRAHGTEVLDAAVRLRRHLAKQRLAAPLILTPEELKTSADVFPIEFLELRENHRVLYGPDVLADLAIGLANLRHECEHELKGRLIRLRQSAVEAGLRPKPVAALLIAAHGANFPAFRAALRLKKIQPPIDKEGVLKLIGEQFGLSVEILGHLQSLRRGQFRITPESVQILLGNYCREVEKLADAVDRL